MYTSTKGSLVELTMLSTKMVRIPLSIQSPPGENRYPHPETKKMQTRTARTALPKDDTAAFVPS